MKKILFGLLFVLIAFSVLLGLLAISRPNQQVALTAVDQTGLTITNPQYLGTPSEVSDLSCSVSNDSTKEVSAFTVLWVVTTDSGKVLTASTMEDNSLVASSKKFSPGETRECSTTGGIITAPRGDKIQKVEASVDYVLFGDRTTKGMDKTRSALQIRNRQLGANYLRSHLREIYRKKGVDDLLRELNAPSN
jgi:hypothetical protein